MTESILTIRGPSSFLDKISQTSTILKIIQKFRQPKSNKSIEFKWSFFCETKQIRVYIKIEYVPLIILT